MREKERKKDEEVMIEENELKKDIESGGQLKEEIDKYVQVEKKDD